MRRYEIQIFGFWLPGIILIMLKSLKGFILTRNVLITETHFVRTSLISAKLEEHMIYPNHQQFNFQNKFMIVVRTMTLNLIIFAVSFFKFHAVEQMFSSWYSLDDRVLIFCQDRGKKYMFFQPMILFPFGFFRFFYENNQIVLMS